MGRLNEHASMKRGRVDDEKLASRNKSASGEDSGHVTGHLI